MDAEEATAAARWLEVLDEVRADSSLVWQMNAMRWWPSAEGGLPLVPGRHP